MPLRSIAPSRRASDTSYRRYPNWIAAYLDRVVPRTEAPERFHFWVASTIIAGVLRRRTYIDMEAFKWYPNLFLILVGPPGSVKKSTTINIGARLLRKVPDIHFSSDIITWEAFIEQLENAVDIFADPPSNNRFSFEDKHHDTRALTSIISEWGTFIDPDKPLMINMLTELYDGKEDIPLRKTTKTQGESIIHNPFVNMIAGTTPAWMIDNFKTKFGGWGFSSRCIFLYCLEPERFIAYPDETWRGEFRSAMDELLADLIEISRLNGPMTITPDARDYGRQWYATHMQRKADLDRHPNHDPWLAYYLARKFDHAQKLAIILSAARSDGDRFITLPDLRSAIARCDEVELELANIFGSHAASQSRAGRLNMDVWRALESMIRKNNGGIPERAAYQFTLRYMSYGETKAFFDHCTASNLLGREVSQGQSWLVLGPSAATPQNPTTTT